MKHKNVKICLVKISPIDRNVTKLISTFVCTNHDPYMFDFHYKTLFTTPEKSMNFQAF